LLKALNDFFGDFDVLTLSTTRLATFRLTATRKVARNVTEIRFAP